MGDTLHGGNGHSHGIDLQDVAVRFRLKACERSVLEAILEHCLQNGKIRTWEVSEEDLGIAAGYCRNSASNGVKGLERKGLVTSRRRSSGGTKKIYLPRTDVLSGAATAFDQEQQLPLTEWRATPEDGAPVARYPHHDSAPSSETSLHTTNPGWRATLDKGLSERTNLNHSITQIPELPYAVFDGAADHRSLTAVFRKWWAAHDLDSRAFDQTDVLAAFLAAHDRKATDPSRYVATCLAQGIKPNWRRRAEALLKPPYQKPYAPMGVVR